MATVLILDDDRGKRDEITRRLEKAGHSVACLDGQTARSLFTSLQEQFRDNPTRRWDFAILDVHHANDAWGGIHLWDPIKENLHQRFGHVIVCTLYMEGYDVDAYQRVRRFAKENDIPEDNLVDFKTTDVKWLVSRLQQLATITQAVPQEKAMMKGPTHDTEDPGAPNES